MDKNRFILGTAQFGQDYGINNVRGKIPEKEVFDILSEAYNSGVDTLDSAPAYGNSEALIGAFIKNEGREFKVISKLPARGDVEKIAGESLKKLNIRSLYGYLIHHFEDFRNEPGILDKLRALQSDGKVKKIGFSLYYPEELDYLFEKQIKFDIVQLPYSVFDQRFQKHFKFLKDKNIEIHARSVFLQGIVFKNPHRLNGDFESIKNKITKLNTISESSDVPVYALCINFAFLNGFIDKIVAGVDSFENLKDILKAQSYISKAGKLYKDLLDLKEDNENIILPFNWKRI
jgi:aryl-alcohol dehydrogenase-like predicted oxidoreductase